MSVSSINPSVSTPGGQYGQIRRGRMAADVLREQFTQISNAALRDERLSFKARGVLAWLASHQDGFGCSVAAIEAASTGDGREAVRSALKELQQLGYLTMEQTRDPGTGRVGPSDYVVTDIPSAGEPFTGNPSTGVTSGNAASSQVRPVNGLTVDGKSPTKNTTPKNTRENPVSTTSSSSPKYGAGSDDDGSINAEQAHEIACAVIAVRPEWQTPGILAQIRTVQHIPFEVVRAAFVEAAHDRSLYTPMHLAAAASDRSVRFERKAAKDEERSRDAESWRKELHDDVTHRAAPESRAEYVARLKAEAAAARVTRQAKAGNRSA